jgi:hypothetical protein
MNKPLNKPAYGSIPHLIGSKAGVGDSYIHIGQHNICTEQPRKGDLIIVQEKYDGSCVSVAKLDGKIIPLNKAGYHTDSSPYEQQNLFSKWVNYHKKTFDYLLEEGDRIVGEWMLQAHGNITTFPKGFIAFDYFEGDRRLSMNEFLDKIKFSSLMFPRMLACSDLAVSIEEALLLLEEDDPIIPCDNREGLIYRVEREGKVDFIAKYVKPNFPNGRYLPEISGKDPIYNNELYNFLKTLV